MEDNNGVPGVCNHLINLDEKERYTYRINQAQLTFYNSNYVVLQNRKSVDFHNEIRINPYKNQTNERNDSFY